MTCCDDFQVWIRRPAEAVGPTGGISNGNFRVLRRTERPGHKRVLVNGSNAVSHRSPAFQSDFEIDLEHCPNCGGEIEIIVAIFESAVIERLLTHVGL